VIIKPIIFNAVVALLLAMDIMHEKKKREGEKAQRRFQHHSQKNRDRETDKRSRLTDE